MYEFTSQRINPDALQQTEVWYDYAGNCHKIAEMDGNYVKCVINFLYKKAWKMNPHNTPLMKALKQRRAEAVAEYKEAQRAKSLSATMN